MEAFKAIAWFVALALSAELVFQLVSIRILTNFLPEGKRWWHLPSQWLAMGLFAAVILNHPF